MEAIINVSNYSIKVVCHVSEEELSAVVTQRLLTKINEII